MKKCKICNEMFDPEQPLETPEEELGDFLSHDKYKDPGQLCRACLANRGRLGIQFMKEYIG